MDPHVRPVRVYPRHQCDHFQKRNESRNCCRQMDPHGFLVPVTVYPQHPRDHIQKLNESRNCRWQMDPLDIPVRVCLQQQYDQFQKLFE